MEPARVARFIDGLLVASLERQSTRNFLTANEFENSAGWDASDHWLVRASS